MTGKELSRFTQWRIKWATYLYLFLGGKDVQESMGYTLALAKWVETNLPPFEIQQIMDEYIEDNNLYAEMGWPNKKIGGEHD
jgi:hypothetical protein